MSHVPWNKPKGNLSTLFPNGFEVQRQRPKIPPEQEFLEAMQAHGLTPQEVIPDGKLNRFAVNGKAGDRSGWYVLHLNGIPAGAFGNWKTDLQVTWCSLDGEADAQTMERLRVQVQAAQRERDAERERRAIASEQQATDAIKAAQPAPADHPYLKAKGIQPHGLSVDTENRLLVPMMDEDGVLRSLQRISPNGDKRFLAGGRKKGCYWLLGEPGTHIYIAEGFATAATVHDLTGEPVAVAFDAGNLTPAAQAIRSRWPHARLTFAADNDRATPGNPGLTKATEAAASLRGDVVAPQFQGSTGTDWNDLARQEGVEAARRQLLPETDTEDEVSPPLVADFLAEVYPEREQMIGPAKRDSLFLIAAPAGVGKTQMGLAVANALTTGVRWCHWEVPKPRAVLYVDGEMSGRDMQDRLRAYPKIGMQAPMRIFNAITWGASQGLEHPNLADPKWRALLLRWAAQVDLVVLDNVMSLVSIPGVSMSSDEFWRPMYDLGLALRAAGKSTITFDHTNSGGEVFGTKTKTWNADLAAVLGPISPESDWGKSLKSGVHGASKNEGSVNTDPPGTAFTMMFTKQRGVQSQDVAPCEVRMVRGMHGESVWQSRWKEEGQIAQVVEMLKEGMTQREISTEMNLSVGKVNKLAQAAKKLGLV